MRIRKGLLNRDRVLFWENEIFETRWRGDAKQCEHIFLPLVH